ncbi:NAD(P)H-dependent oxidoreductase [Candidatus Woesearchaeota archaeon]|nr:NAD(P)H-dependent oxidoreductase [Candidatus Woesearchaeota archaeon]
MRTIIIYVHPAKKGHNASFLERAERWLRENDEEYELVDLYEKGYDPVLQKQEHPSSGTPAVSEETKRYQEKIKGADRLILIYPIWNGGPPAILKGFFDRVFTARFAFRYQRLPFPIFGLRARPVGLLRGKKAVVFLTSGSMRWTQRLFLRDFYRVAAKKAVLSFCGIRTKVSLLDGCTGPLTRRQRQKIERMAVRGLRWLF